MGSSVSILVPKYRIECGDARELTARLAPESVDCVVTSPPYYALRDYHVDGQYGLEPTMHEYIDKILGVMDELWRVLKPTGSLWLNLGDTYFNGVVGAGGTERLHAEHFARIMFDPVRVSAPVGRKSLMGVPWRIALAMLDRGWILRNVVVYAKPNPIPHPVFDRLTASWEPVFFFTKSDRYYFDLDQIRVPQSSGPSVVPWDALDHRTELGTEPMGDVPASRTHAIRARKRPKGYTGHPLGKNPGDVWWIAPEGGDDRHYATFPERLVARCLQASCPPKVCATCHRPPIRRRTGWEWCGCGGEREPGTVLDPFVGSGTTVAVAVKLGLNGIGFDLSPEYCEIARKRVESVRAPMLDLDKEAEQSMDHRWPSSQRPRALSMLETGGWS
jgi:site-specific DNA-methyltransferase (adenine-specific)